MTSIEDNIKKNIEQDISYVITVSTFYKGTKFTSDKKYYSSVGDTFKITFNGVDVVVNNK